MPLDLSITFAVGARWVCAPCRLRVSTPTCPVCRAPGLDLAESADRAALAGAPELGRAWAAGRGLLSPSVLFGTRWGRRLGMACLVGYALAPVLGPLLSGRQTGPAELIVGAVVGPLLAPFGAAVTLLALWAAAHVLRLLGAVLVPLRAVADRARVGRKDLALVAWLCARLPGLFLPQVELEREDAAGGEPLVGHLAAPLTIEVRRDSLGVLERGDAHLPPFALLDAQGRRHAVALAAGAVSYPPGLGQRDPAGPDEGLPLWLRAPGRPGVGFRRTFPAGARVSVQVDAQARGRVSLAAAAPVVAAVGAESAA